MYWCQNVISKTLVDNLQNSYLLPRQPAINICYRWSVLPVGISQSNLASKAKPEMWDTMRSPFLEKHINDIVSRIWWVDVSDVTLKKKAILCSYDDSCLIRDKRVRSIMLFDHGSRSVITLENDVTFVYIWFKTIFFANLKYASLYINLFIL